MNQGYEMQKHRADGLKGHLDTANRRIETLESEFAEIEQLAKSRLATACALQAEVEKLEEAQRGLCQTVDMRESRAIRDAERVAELKQLLGSVLIRLKDLGDTEFKLPDQGGKGV